MREWIYDWLSRSEPPGASDLIFSLAGRQNRKAYALQLFRQGLAPQLLLSAARYEIRRFSDLDLPVPVDLRPIASSVAPPERHFFVSFEGPQAQVERIAVQRLGTLGEIEALTRWLRLRPSIQSIQIVSSGAHIRRVRLCCQKLLPERSRLRFLNALCAKAAPAEEEGGRQILLEIAKLLVYRIVLAPAGLRIRELK